MKIKNMIFLGWKIDKLFDHKVIRGSHNSRKFMVQFYIHEYSRTVHGNVHEHSIRINLTNNLE